MDLGLGTTDNTENKTLKEVIAKPEWSVINSEKKHKSDKTLIPDLVVYNQEDKSISIYDAKYYNIMFTEEELRGYPGVQDVSKQYLYELAYKNFIQENGLKMKENAFIMPTDNEIEEELEEIGEIKFEIFKSMNLQGIKVKLASATKMYEKYLKK